MEAGTGEAELEEVVTAMVQMVAVTEARTEEVETGTAVTAVARGVEETVVAAVEKAMAGAATARVEVVMVAAPPAAQMEARAVARAVAAGMAASAEADCNQPAHLPLTSIHKSMLPLEAAHPPPRAILPKP